MQCFIKVLDEDKDRHRDHSESISDSAHILGLSGLIWSELDHWEHTVLAHGLVGGGTMISCK